MDILVLLESEREKNALNLLDDCGPDNSCVHVVCGFNDSNN